MTTTLSKALETLNTIVQRWSFDLFSSPKNEASKSKWCFELGRRPIHANIIDTGRGTSTRLSLAG